MTVQQLGQNAKGCAAQINTASTADKNRALSVIAEELEAGVKQIIEENKKDIATAREMGIPETMIDRLMLDEGRISGIADAVRTLIDLDDPVGVVERGFTRPNGLVIHKTRVPLGVIGIIFESRPNVSVDAATLCLKAGNAVILRGGKEAINSNRALVGIMRRAVEKCGFDPNIIQLVDDTSRESANQMMKLSGFIDVLIPRGGHGLIQAVVQNATVPVIETGTGNCHIYVDKAADLAMAADIVYNAKTSRPSVCNAAESLLVHQAVAQEFLPMVKQRLDEKGVQLFGCAETRSILEGIQPATEEDYAAEYLDYKMSVKVVASVEEAVEHIRIYSTHHSDCIVTNDLAASELFTRSVDSAAVYVNASTRFTDGGEFGFGAEIGISTQKLHARGPMGLNELTSVKYVVHGNGQIR
ncbi:glutamate-5-semialdehyde dehydrogenase [[Clostridium] methylpentosum DSM 5476]|jgi:glutamate-5-semialdehyde dehydrogenase|uniref:Gamma-glutamyl phosphate reductase n=1 Tax=[Clostridium] methylpentosum DSM 5476 TaxID=537013 RepID=C0EBI3_9FIRM|nr:glutamate-5-semialdehyde dehydrogenase [[Clostridium] methylpentosum DSM 5476]MDY3988183.1 glutamate-5-semialdehyde dehydrogenase [Massilioclostridium sp.]MEE1490793.1 glutamate-5-semialdehyde dehydrogenase [Massilioclostridium sp.]